MVTKIQPITKSKTIDYSEKLLQNFWQQKSNFSANGNHKSQILKTLLSVQEGMVCIQTESLTDNTLIKKIFDIAQNLNVRFYILVNEYSQELDLLNEICLIRYDVKNIGSLILVNPNSDKPQGAFFTGQLTEQSMSVSQHLTRSLEGKENEELFRHFCFQFWETAKKEVIEKGKHTNITSKPLDVFHNAGVFGGKDFVYGTLFDFSENAKRNELSGKQIIYLNNEKEIPVTIHPKYSKDLGDKTFDNLLPKTEFENIEPNFVDDGISVIIEFKWQNIPLYLPENAIVNLLYERWKTKKEEFTKALDSILNKIHEAEKKEGSLSKAISRFFLGKKNVFGALKNEIDDLKTTDFANQTEAKLKEKINRINEIYLQVQNEIGEIETEDRKAKLEEEMENLKNQISEQESALLEKKKDLAEKMTISDKKCDDFCQKYGFEKSKLGQEKNHLEQLAGEKNKKKNPDEAEKAARKLQELKEIDDEVFINKTKNEVESIEKQINSLKGQIGSKEKEKNKQIVQSESSSSLNEIVSGKNSNHNNSGKSQLIQNFDYQQYPQLPQTGILYQVNSQSYLAIELWEEYEQGKKEAERLKAKLCTIKN